MTNDIAGYAELRRIDDEAAAWAARRLSGDFSAADAKEFEAWIAADRRHEIALGEYMDIAEESALAGAAFGIRAPANDEAPPAREPKEKLVLRRWVVATPAIAACIAAAFFIAGVPGVAPVTPERFATARGETRDVSLADGTLVTLNTDTRLVIAYSDGERLARLEQGEAFFDVTRDPARPFVVDADEAQVTVLGTSFTVRNTTGAALVSVVSGVVSVAPTAAGNDERERLQLSAGERVTISADGGLGGVARFDVQRAATWRDGYLYFDKTPLGDVVADLNRYFDAQIELSSAQLSDDPMSGRIELQNHDVALRAISAAMSLEAHEVAPEKFVLRRHD